MPDLNDSQPACRACSRGTTVDQPCEECGFYAPPNADFDEELASVIAQAQLKGNAAMKIDHEYAHHVADDVRGRLETAVENLEAARRTLDELGYGDDHDIPMEVSTAYLDEYEIAALLLRAGTHLRALRTNWLVQEVLPAPTVAA